MDDIERLRALVGPDADGWTTAQLEQLQRDIDAMALLLLDVYRPGRRGRRKDGCGSLPFDVPQSDR